MTLWKLDEWEMNGRDDSDWYAVVYNDETDKLERVQTGSTRFADALHIGPPMEEPTPEVRTKARVALAGILFRMMKHSEEIRILQPGPDQMHRGVRVRFLQPHRCMAKEKTGSPCSKCDGTGKWTNPRNAEDKRECFACKGSGQVMAAYTKKKTADGKQEWISVEKGAVGEVVFAKAYGTFYKSGYNQPNSFNTTVTIKLDDGREVRTPLNKLRLDCEIDSDEALQKKATKVAESDCFYGPFRTAGVRL